ncbi:CFDP2, partial [Symbiodinium pilosum]
MQQYKLYALALSEVRLDFQGSHIYEDGFTIIASGVGARGGTALLLSPGATSAWQLAGSRSVGHPSGRVCSCTLALGGKEGTVKLISAYSPTFRAPDGDIDSFWAAVRAETSSSGMVVVLGDCNARVGCRPRVVGARAADDQDSVLGFHGIGACNEMGQRMLDFCQTEHLRITNTFFPHSVANKASWYHLGSRNPGLLDYALVRTVDAAFVTNCRHYPNIDVDSDHVLGILDMRQRPCARTSRMTAPAPPAERHQRLRSEVEFTNLASRKVVANLTPAQLPAVLYECGVLRVLVMYKVLVYVNGRFLTVMLFVIWLGNEWPARQIGLQYVAWSMNGGLNKRHLCQQLGALPKQINPHSVDGGDIADLGNWRGICLLPVLSKVMATLVNDSLRSLAENVLAESQEVRLTTPPPPAAQADPPRVAAAPPPPGLFVLFVDLCKVFDSMPRSIMWRILTRLGATLWDLYYHYVVLDWRQRLGANSGLDVAYLEDSGLFRTCAGVLGSQDAMQIHISELAYADDLATLHLSWSELCRAAQLLSDTVRDWGGELNIGKTKWMCVQSALLPTGAVDLELFVDGDKVEQITEFEYLGSVSNDADLGQLADVRRRLRQASKTFGSLRGLWRSRRSRRITLNTKRTVFLAVVKSVVFAFPAQLVVDVPVLLLGVRLVELVGEDVAVLLMVEGVADPSFLAVCAGCEDRLQSVCCAIGHCTCLLRAMAPTLDALAKRVLQLEKAHELTAKLAVQTDLDVQRERLRHQVVDLPPSRRPFVQDGVQGAPSPACCVQRGRPEALQTCAGERPRWCPAAGGWTHLFAQLKDAWAWKSFMQETCGLGLALDLTAHLQLWTLSAVLICNRMPYFLAYVPSATLLLICLRFHWLRGGMQIFVKTLTGKTITLDVE